MGLAATAFAIRPKKSCGSQTKEITLGFFGAHLWLLLTILVYGKIKCLIQLTFVNHCVLLEQRKQDASCYSAKRHQQNCETRYGERTRNHFDETSKRTVPLRNDFTICAPNVCSFMIVVRNDKRSAYRHVFGKM